MKKKLLAAFVLMVCGVHCAYALDVDTDSLGLDNVVVTGVRMAATPRNIPATINVVDRERLIENQRTSVLQTLTEQVPGLFVTQRAMMGFGVSGNSAGSINLRGISAGTGQLLVLIDGHPQYQGVFGHSIADSYQTMMAERVEVMRGPASVLYGSNAMGGVINIVTRGMEEDGARSNISLGAGSYGTLQAEASNQVRKGKFSSTVSALYARSDNHRPHMGFEQFGGYIKLGYDLTQNWNVFADVDVIHFNASNPGLVSSPMLEADQWITRGVATLALENHYDKTNGRISVYDNFGIHKINDGYAINGGSPQTEFFRSKDALVGITWYQTANFFKGNYLTAGIDYQHIYGRAYYTSRQTGEIVNTGKRKMQSAHAHSNEIAAYLDVRQNIASWLTINAGIRYDNHSVAGGEWVPQAGVVARPLETATIKCTVSKGFRNPTNKDLYLYGVANDSLHAERLWNYEIAWNHSVLDGTLKYGVNLFIMKGDNMIQTVPVVQIDGTTKTMNMNTGEISNKGVEVEAEWRICDHWSVNTNHSFLHMDNHVIGAPEYKGYIGAAMRYGKWKASLGVQQICGLFTSVGKTEVKEDFTLVNATVNYQICNLLGVWVKGENLLAQKYEINAGFPMPKATFMGGVNIAF